jgi:hypothetical protein
MCACVCVYSCLIQHTKRIGHFIFSSVFCLVLPYFSTLSHEQHDFRGEKNIEHEMHISIPLQVLSETLLILRKIQRDAMNTLTSACKVPIVLVIC